VEPGGRRRPGRVPRHLRREARLELSAALSLPTINWVRWGDDGAAHAPIWPLERILDAVAGAGCPGVGLDHYTLDAYERDELGGLLQSRGLVCTDVAVLPIGQPHVLDAAHRLASVATATGAPICIAAVYEPMPDADAVRDLCAAAEILTRAGARLALEFAAYGGLRELPRAIELCAAVGWERCGLLLDAWHFFRTGAPWSELRSLGPGQIAMVHVNDGASPAGDPVDDGRCRRLPVRTGTFPITEFLDAVDATGFDGVVSAEVLSSDVRARTPEEGARVLMQSLRSTARPAGPA
jgi:sugar phosphate isomerase/epimerase